MKTTLIKKIKKRLSETGGFTMTELLVATMIMLMATGMLTQTMTYAIDQYHKSTQNTEAQLLCSTICNYVSAELSYAVFDMDAFKPGSVTFESDVHHMGSGAHFMIVPNNTNGSNPSEADSFTEVTAGSTAVGRVVETSPAYDGSDYFDIAGAGSYNLTGHKNNKLYAGMKLIDSGGDSVIVDVWVQDSASAGGKILAQNRIRIIPMEIVRSE